MKKLWLASCILSASALSHSIDVSLSSDSIQFSKSGADNISVTVSGPENYNDAFTQSSSYVAINVQDINQSDDGVYHYNATSTEILGNTEVSDNNGRGSANKNIVNSDNASGHFRIENGEIVIGTEEE